MTRSGSAAPLERHTSSMMSREGRIRKHLKLSLPRAFYIGYNHTGHPHAKGSKANTFLETFRNASNAHFCHICCYNVVEKGNIMSKLPSLASAILYRDVQGSSYSKISARIVDSDE